MIVMATSFGKETFQFRAVRSHSAGRLQYRGSNRWSEADALLLLSLCFREQEKQRGLKTTPADIPTGAKPDGETTRRQNVQKNDDTGAVTPPPARPRLPNPWDYVKGERLGGSRSGCQSSSNKANVGETAVPPSSPVS